jgi:hypothetical protein
MNRFTHAYGGSLALFLVGVRIHKPWRVGVVGPTMAAMPRMLRELEDNAAAAERGEADHLGFLGARTMVDGLGATTVQWWRSVEDVYAYAAAPSLEHRPAWRRFSEYARKDPGAVTIWHETYAVPAGAHESVYAGPLAFGLGALAGVVPVARRGERARERMGLPATPPS